MVRSQHMHSRRERNLNDGGRRLQHFTTRTIREKEVSRKRQSRAPQSTAEHGKAPFIERRGGYVQYTNPYHPYREAEDSRAQQGSVEKGGKKEGETRKWTGFPIIALHSTLLQEQKKEVTTTPVHYFPDCKERGGGMRCAFQLHALQAITWCP